MIRVKGFDYYDQSGTFGSPSISDIRTTSARFFQLRTQARVFSQRPSSHLCFCQLLCDNMFLFDFLAFEITGLWARISIFFFQQCSHNFSLQYVPLMASHPLITLFIVLLYPALSYFLCFIPDLRLKFSVFIPSVGSENAYNFNRIFSL